MVSIVCVLMATLVVHAILISMTVILPHRVLMARVLMVSIHTLVCAMLDGQDSTVISILLTVLLLLATMEELVWYVRPSITHTALSLYCTLCRMV